MRDKHTKQLINDNINIRVLYSILTIIEQALHTPSKVNVTRDYLGQYKVT